MTVTVTGIPSFSIPSSARPWAFVAVTAGGQKVRLPQASEMRVAAQGSHSCCWALP